MSASPTLELALYSEYMKLPDDDGYATFVLRLQGFMIGSAGVYDDYDADGVSILVSKRGIFCKESPEIRFLSPAGMKTLLSVDADIRRSIQELNCLNRREALEFITKNESSRYLGQREKTSSNIFTFLITRSLSSYL